MRLLFIAISALGAKMEDLGFDFYLSKTDIPPFFGNQMGVDAATFRAFGIEKILLAFCDINRLNAAVRAGIPMK